MAGMALLWKFQYVPLRVEDYAGKQQAKLHFHLSFHCNLHKYIKNVSHKVLYVFALILFAV